MKRLMIALSTLCIFALPAQAARIEFRGSFHITSASPACVDDGYPIGYFFTFRYNPRNVGDNGPSTRLSILDPNLMENYTLQSGSLIGTTFRLVDAAGIARGFFTFPAHMRITSQVPATPTLTTVSVTLNGNIQQFDSDPNCQIGFTATGYARVK